MRKGEACVRAIYRSVAAPDAAAPYDRLSLKIYYPALFGDTAEERNSGLVPVDPSHGKLPIVMILPGINLGAEAYTWLSHALAEAGYLVVTYSWIAEEMPGYVSLTPGLTLDALTPQGSGRQPSSPAIQLILDEMAGLDRDSILAGHIDLENVILGGHSAGGTMAMLNARKTWFPEVKGFFSYAAHSGASVMLGWDNDTILPLDSDMNALVMGGTLDGVIASSSHRYGSPEDTSSTDRVKKTFETLTPNDKHHWLAFIEGANHFTFAWPQDNATGRPFLEDAETCDNSQARALMAELITGFCHLCAGKGGQTPDLTGNGLVAESIMR